MNTQVKWFLTGIACIILCASTAPAQETADPKDVLDTLTVTAQKREENLQDVPISVDLFTDMTLGDYGLNTMSDVTMQSANVFMKTNTAESPLIIRGISSFKSAIFSPAGFYVDDVSMPLSYMTNPDLLDLKRIEILKGPQGTLYGRNTLSGLVNLVTRKPDNETRGQVTLETGVYDSKNDGMFYRAGAMFSGPIKKDLLFLGVSVQGLNSDGFRTDIATGDPETASKEHYDARGTLRYTPSDALDISFTASGCNHNDGFGVYRLVTGASATPSHTVNSGDPGLGLNEDSDFQNLKVNYQGQGWHLVSITSRMAYDIDYTSDMDFAGGAMYSGFGFDDTQWSQEIRIASDGSGVWDWLAGAYGFHEDTGTYLDIQSANFHMWHPEADIETNGAALFSQVTWHWHPKWEITGGLRWDHQELSGQVNNDVTTMMSSLPACQNFSEDLSYDELLPKIALGYAPGSWANIYASAAKGYQTGGYNYSMVMSDETFTYDPEYSWNYELGMKTVFFNNRLRVNTSLFYVDITDKQLYVNNPNVTSLPMAPDITNAGKAHTCGAELGIYADPKPGISLFATLGLLKTEIDQWTNTSSNGTVDYSGNELPYSPHYSVSAGGTYRVSNGLFIGADLTRMGSYYGQAANTQKQSAFELVNLRVGYEAESFDLILWCKNVFDQEYFTLLDEMSSTGALKAVEGDPRTFGVTLTYRF